MRGRQTDRRTGFRVVQSKTPVSGTRTNLAASCPRNSYARGGTQSISESLSFSFGELLASGPRYNVIYTPSLYDDIYHGQLFDSRKILVSQRASQMRQWGFRESIRLLQITLNSMCAVKRITIMIYASAVSCGRLGRLSSHAKYQGERPGGFFGTIRISPSPFPGQPGIQEGYKRGLGRGVTS